MLIPAKKTRKINCTRKMYEETWVTVTFLANLMFCRLNKFDGLIFGGGGAGRIYRRAYFQDVNWVTYLGCTFGWGLIDGLIYRGALTEFYGIATDYLPSKKHFFLGKFIIAGLSVLSIAWRETFSLSEQLNCRSFY